VNVTTAANTAYTTVIPLEPALTSEWASLIALYDECRVTHSKFQYKIESGGALPVAGVMGVLAFDAADVTALASVVNGAEFAQHKLLDLSYVSDVAGAAVVEYLPLKMGVFNIKHSSTPDARSATNNAVFDGEFSATVDAADIYGWIKPFIEAGGVAATTYTISGVLYHTVQFRSRK